MNKIINIAHPYLYVDDPKFCDVYVFFRYKRLWE